MSGVNARASSDGYRIVTGQGQAARPVRVERGRNARLDEGPGYTVFRRDRERESFVAILAGKEPILRASTKQQHDAWRRAEMVAYPVRIVRGDA